MKTIGDLNADILKMSILIQTNYPELSQHLTEMPVTIPNVPSPEINVSTLTEYNESLKVLLKDYIENQRLLTT